MKLTERRQKVLRYLAARGDECLQQDVAHAIGVMRGAMGPIVRSLEARGLLEALGQYPRWLRITEAGRAWLEQAGYKGAAETSMPAAGTDGARRS